MLHFYKLLKCALLARKVVRALKNEFLKQNILIAYPARITKDRRCKLVTEIRMAPVKSNVITIRRTILKRIKKRANASDAVSVMRFQFSSFR